jgi:hypothetical protein
MKQGFLLFAHNNEEVDYGIMAVWQAKRISKFLSKPVSLVTDSTTISSLDVLYPSWKESFDQVILTDLLATQTKRYIDRSLTFHNIDRTQAWNLTPYDETIVVDTDVIIQSSKFNLLWNNVSDLIVCKNSPDLYGVTSEEFTWISEKSLPFYWATTFFFRKNEETKIFFDHCNFVKENYSWYKHIHELNAGPVRNDFVWSIALHDLGGKQSSFWASIIPWDLLHSEDKDYILHMTDTAVKFLTDRGLCLIKDHDVHVFNKFNLLEQIKKELEILQ